MVKHINRVSKEDETTKKHYNQDVSAEDEWSHITGVGTKIEAADPLNVSDRTIFFSSKSQASTKQELIQERSEEIKDQMSNTNQYLKFVNVLLKQKTDNLKKILEQEKRFAEELSFFQDSPKPRVELEKMHSKYVKENDVKSILVNLEAEYDKIKEKLDYEQTLITRTKSELESKRQQIDAIREELQILSKKKDRPPEEDPIMIIRHEMKRLGIKDESGRINRALGLLTDKLDGA